MNIPKLTFGDFDLDLARYELRRHGRAVKLEHIPMELLLLLVDRRGQLVTREEILQKLWGKDVFLDVDNSINTAISKLRVALRDGPEDPAFIKTVPGKGYRFIAPIVVVPEGRGPSTGRSAMPRGGQVQGMLAEAGAGSEVEVAGPGPQFDSKAQVKPGGQSRSD